jgi:hypothetical protein
VTGTPASTSGERAQHARVAARDHRGVLEPEVEQVAVQDQLVGAGSGVLEPAQKGALALARDRTQMDVAGEIGRSARHDVSHGRRSYSPLLADRHFAGAGAAFSFRS